MEEKIKLIRIRQAAEMLGVNRETLRRWDNEGKLKAYRVGNRKGVGDRRYKLEDIEEYLRKRRSKLEFLKKHDLI